LLIESVHLPNGNIKRHFIDTDGDNRRNAQHEQEGQANFPHSSTDIDEIISDLPDNGNSGLDH
jgi:hypothetical protein